MQIFFAAFDSFWSAHKYEHHGLEYIILFGNVLIPQL